MHTMTEIQLQYHIQRLFSDPSRLFICTNGDVIQIVAAGMINHTSGPDLQEIAILYDGTVYIGNAEVHHKASDFYAHQHHHDELYRNLLVHVVEKADVEVQHCRWTLEVGGLNLDPYRRLPQKKHTTTDVEELQRHALLRLLRTTAEATVLIERMGQRHAFGALFNTLVHKHLSRKHRPINAITGANNVYASAMFGIVERLHDIDQGEIHAYLNRALHERFEVYGIGLRLEIIVNVVLPLCCAKATDGQRMLLLQWFWSVKAAHTYGKLTRRFPRQQQDYVWQQQGMLELLKRTNVRSSTCADIIRTYGFDSTLNFLRCYPT